MLTTQFPTVRAYVVAETDPTFVSYKAARNTAAITDWLNANSTFIVWRNSTPVADIFDAIIWANMTPASAPDGTTTWTNRNLQCQSKQLNLQNILIGRENINSSKANIRAGLQDALTAIPSKADGTNQAAGWINVQSAMQRATTRCEKLFATGVGTTASPGLLGWEGQITNWEVDRVCWDDSGNWIGG